MKKLYNRNIYTLLILTIIQFFLSFPCRASEITYKDILKKNARVNYGLKTFKSKLKMKVIFMGVGMPVSGILYYKRPNKIKLKLPLIPSILKNRKGIFRQAVPRSFSSVDYKGKILRKERLSKQTVCYLLELEPRKTGKILKILVWVDMKSCLTPRSEIYYRNGSVINSVQSFRREGKYFLPDKQRIEFDFPKFRASTIVRYIKYEINVPVDHVFSKNLKKK